MARRRSAGTVPGVETDRAPEGLNFAVCGPSWSSPGIVSPEGRQSMPDGLAYVYNLINLSKYEKYSLHKLQQYRRQCAGICTGPDHAGNADERA